MRVSATGRAGAVGNSTRVAAETCPMRRRCHTLVRIFVRARPPGCLADVVYA
jgi:hypothetical protein